jgi:hypothetical protein
LPKTCVYCGRDNTDDATHCQECGGVEFKEFTPSSAETVPRADEGSQLFVPIKPDEKDHTWVTLLRCRNLLEADLYKTRLEAADIPAFIPDEFLLQAIAWNVNTYGWVRLQVPPSRYEDAREILSA